MLIKLNKYIYRLLIVLLYVLHPANTYAQDSRLVDINAWDFSQVIAEFKKKTPNENVMALTTSVTRENGFSEENAHYISTKVDSVVGSLGLKHPSHSRFVITAKIDTVSFDNYTERYGTDLFSGRLRLFVYDIIEEQILSSFEYKLRAKTVGLDSCLAKSLSSVDFESEEFKSFLESSMSAISQYYDKGIANVWNKYRNCARPYIIYADEFENKTITNNNEAFDSAISYFLSVPKNHRLHETCMKYAAYLSMIKGEFNNKQYLLKGCADIGWNGNESEQATIKRNKNSIKTLNKIPKWSVYYAAACEEKERAKEYTLTSKQQQNKQNREMDKGWDEYVANKIREVGGDPNPKPVKIQGNTEFGLFVIGALLTAWAICPPAVPAYRYILLAVPL